MSDPLLGEFYFCCHFLLRGIERMIKVRVTPGSTFKLCFEYFRESYSIVKKREYSSKYKAFKRLQ